MATRHYISASVYWSEVNTPVQLLTPSGSRVNVTAGAASSSEAALPAGSVALRIGATEACFIRFGNTGMGAAALDTTSMYFPAGVEYLAVPLDAAGAPYDYVRAIRVTSSDSVVQFERVA